MWLAVEAVAPPEVPYETIGLVVVALITAIAGVVVAVVQRGKKTSSSPEGTATPGDVLTKSDPEWTKFRDTTILTRGTIHMVEREVRGVSDQLDEHITKAAHRQGKTESQVEHNTKRLDDIIRDFNTFKDSFR